MTAPQLTEPANLPPAPADFTNTTLRQVIRVSLGGKRIRVRSSNEFGTAPLTLTAARLALPGTGGGPPVPDSGAIQPGSDRGVTFKESPSVVVAPGGSVVSDAVPFDLAPLSALVVTVHATGGGPRNAPAITGHPGSRRTSYLQQGDHVSAPDLIGAVKTDHWYFLSGVEIQAAGKNSGAIVTLGDSITDGRGSPTNGDGRWPNYLARRLHASRDTAGRVAVLNAGIGGNCVIRGGLGPSALARLDRDVLAQPGARWLVVFEGVNDLGTRAATGPDLINAYKEIAARARKRGLRLYGATLLPCGDSFYFTLELETARQTINEWMRESKTFDAVIDFDAVLRDPKDPTRLSPAAESQDRLHPSGRGYEVIANAIDLTLFR